MTQRIQNAAATVVIVGLVGFAVFFGLRQDETQSGSENETFRQSQRSPSTTVSQKPPRSTGSTRDETRNASENTMPESQYAETISEADLRDLRNDGVQDVLLDYSLIFRHLGLTEAEEKALTDFLVEVWMSSTYTRGYRPVPIDEDDRRAGIAATIGDENLEKLLRLEQNRAEYREAQRVANLLEASNVPLTDAKLDQLLDILIQVRGREQAVADPHAEFGTLEWIQSKYATMDEYERLVLELAPSVLSAIQINLLYHRYESLSRKRAELIEKQKRSRANDDPEDDVPLGYYPRQ